MSVCTHLCGSLYDEKNRCPHMLYVIGSNEALLMGKRKDGSLKFKKLKRHYVYCKAEGHCRSMGCAASWTGNSPTWCPKRKAQGNSNG